MREKREIMSETKRVAIVTGAASGIGKSVCECLLRENVAVIGVDKNTIDIESCEKYQIDVSNESEVIEMFDLIKSNHSKISYLVNCAGIFCFESRNCIKSSNANEIKKVFDANFFSSFLMTKYVAPLMEECGGAIVNLSSDRTFKTSANNIAYTVSKAAINELTKVSAIELMEQKIRVNAVAAASVRTNFINAIFESKEKIEKIFEIENEKMPLGLIEPEQIAQLICFLLSDKAKNITGQIIPIDSGVLLK